jgi:hypothetical protein
MDRRRRAWAILCIGEPAAEIEDTFADEVPIAFGRQVLRLAFAELGRPRDECRAESRPLANVRSRLRAAAYRGSCRPRSRTTPSGR